MFTLQNLFLIIIGLAIILVILSIAKKLVKFLIIALIILVIVAIAWILISKFNIQLNFLS